MRRSTALILIFVVVFLLGVPVYLGTLGWVRITELYRGYPGTEQFVDIPPGTSTAEIGRRLAEAGVVPDQFTFRAAVWWTGAGSRLKAGEYRFDRALTPVGVIEKLERGDVFTRRITFPEGLTIAEMAALYETRGFGVAADFVSAANDVTAIRAIDPSATDLEGYLFPDTYAIARTASPAALVSMMVERFKAAYNEALAGRGPEGMPGVRETVTLASLVEKETGSVDERTTVAAVYRNRLRIGMAMQADPTVVYALAKVGRYDGNLRREDLAFNSPYNTYRYPGLPPGPIAAPGLAALRAALAPADVPFLYFVSRNDGTHVFARTLAEHNRNVQRFQVEFFRRQRRAGGTGR
jgi:UPF0755 protein